MLMRLREIIRLRINIYVLIVELLTLAFAQSINIILDNYKINI